MFGQNSIKRDLTPRLTSQKSKKNIIAHATTVHSTRSNTRVSKHLGPSNEVFYNVNGAQPQTSDRFATSSQISFRNNSPNDVRLVANRYGKGASKRMDTSLSGILGSEQRHATVASKPKNATPPGRKLDKKIVEMNAANKQMHSQKIK